jgi:hypothetical protein
MYFKKEETHIKGYSPRLESKSINFTGKEWHKASISVYNVGSAVKLEGFFDGKQVITYMDVGGIKGEPYTDEGKWCFIRTNAPDKVSYRNAKMTQI